MTVAGIAVAAVLAAAPRPALGQQAISRPRINTMFGGSASLLYSAPSDSLGHGTAGVKFAPTSLASLGRDMLFEGELDFTAGEDGPDIEVEYAQLDYQGFDHLQIIAGQFLAPFGVFSQRFHMSWINKTPALPLIYADDPVAEDALISMPTGLGVWGEYARSLSDKLDLDVSLYVSQGPHQVPGTPPPGVAGPPQVSLGNTITDNNGNKLLGARIGLIGAPRFEVYLSGFTSKYDRTSTYGYAAANVAAIWRPYGSQIMGELVNVQQGFPQAGQHLTLSQSGYFIQMAKRFGDIEPVARWGQFLDGRANSVTYRPGANRLSLGFEYWLDALSPVKVFYEVNSEGSDRAVIQWAYGF